LRLERLYFRLEVHVQFARLSSSQTYFDVTAVEGSNRQVCILYIPERRGCLSVPWTALGTGLRHATRYSPEQSCYLPLSDEDKADLLECSGIDGSDSSASKLSAAAVVLPDVACCAQSAALTG